MKLRYKKSFGAYVGAFLLLMFCLIRPDNLLYVYSLLAAAFLVVVVQVGIQVDFDKKRYRKINYVGSINVGLWNELPEIKYVSVFKANLHTSVSGGKGGPWSTYEEAILINLIHDHYQHIQVYKTLDKDKAFAIAEQLATGLNVRIYDATTPFAKWKT